MGCSLLPEGISVASAGTVPGLCIRIWPRPKKRSKLDRLMRTLTLTLTAAIVETAAGVGTPAGTGTAAGAGSAVLVLVYQLVLQ